MINKILNSLLLVLLFILPWQTRWIYHQDFLAGVPHEYGTLSFFATEILLWTIATLFIFSMILNKEFINVIKSRPVNRTGLIRLGIFLLVLLWLGLIWLASDNYEVVWQFYSRLLGIVVLGVIIYIQIAKKSLKKVTAIFALWSGSVLEAALAIYQFFNQGIGANKWFGLSEVLPSTLGTNVIETTGERWLRSYGSLGGPNPLGVYLVTCLIFGGILYYFYRDSKIRLLVVMGNLIILSGLFFTFSRGAWLAGIIGGGVFFATLLGDKRNEIKSKQEKICLFLRVALPLVALLFVLSLLFQPLIKTRVIANGRLEEKSIVTRVDQINEWATLFKSNIILGVGPGGYVHYLAKEGIGERYRLPVHNTYLLILGEMGLVFSLGLIGVLVFLVLYTFKNNILFLGVIITLLTAAMFEHWPWSLFPGLLFSAVVISLAVSPKLLPKTSN